MGNPTPAIRTCPVTCQCLDGSCHRRSWATRDELDRILAPQRRAMLAGCWAQAQVQGLEVRVIVAGCRSGPPPGYALAESHEGWSLYRFDPFVPPQATAGFGDGIPEIKSLADVPLPGPGPVTALGAELDHARSRLKELARQALAVLVLDHGYSADLPCRYGHHPLRHQFLWDFIGAALGEGPMAEELAQLKVMAEEERAPPAPPSQAVPDRAGGGEYYIEPGASPCVWDLLAKTPHWHGSLIATFSDEADAEFARDCFARRAAGEGMTKFTPAPGDVIVFRHPDDASVAQVEDCREAARRAGKTYDCFWITAPASIRVEYLDAAALEAAGWVRKEEAQALRDELADVLAAAKRAGVFYVRAGKPGEACRIAAAAREATEHLARVRVRMEHLRAEAEAPAAAPGEPWTVAQVLEWLRRQEAATAAEVKAEPEPPPQGGSWRDLPPLL